MVRNTAWGIGTFLIVAIVSTIVLMAASGARGDDRAVIIHLIDVAGNKRIQASSIRSKISTREGDVFRPEAIREDIKSIYRLGYFDDVRVESEGFEGGMKVTFIVREKPVIVEISYDGNKALTKEKIDEKVVLKTQSFLDYRQLNDATSKIVDAYHDEGYYSAEAIPIVRQIADDKVSVVFFIREGVKATVRRIEIDGNGRISNRKIRKAMQSKTYFFLTSWMTQAGVYKEQDIQDDTQRIRELYLNNGFLQVQVSAPQVTLSKDKRSFTVRYRVVEGDPFMISSVTFKGNTVITDDDLRKAVRSKQGELFKRDVVQSDIAAVTDLYGEKGYAFANILPDIVPHAEKKTADLTFGISEQDPVKIRNIVISGNDRTRDKVIRRELRVQEQEVINTKKLRTSFQRLNNLNFFDTVEVVPRQVDSKTVDLNVRVKEKPTGAFSVGGGFSSVDGLIGILEITQGNLFGRGQLLRARGELGRRSSTYSLSFAEPYILDYPVSGSTEIFNTVRSFDSYKERRTGASLTLGKSFTDTVSGSISYTLENLKLFEVSTTAPLLVRQQEREGRFATSSVSVGVSRDTRDVFIDPRSGSRFNVTGELAGTAFGGENNFYKLGVDVSRYFPLPGESTFLIHGRAGVARGVQGTPLPVGERYYVGGINSVRGFDFGRAGPVDSFNNIVGGTRQLFFNAEYIFPLVPEARIKGVVFVDAGRAFNDGDSMAPSRLMLRYSAGGGLRWLSPMGPLRLEWGYNIHKKTGEQQSAFEFTIGSLF